MASDVEDLSSDQDIIEEVYVYKIENKYPDDVCESKNRYERKPKSCERC